MTSNPYKAFCNAWGADYGEALSFVDAYNLKFYDKSPKWTVWHERAKHKYQHTDVGKALIAICKSLDSGGNGNVVKRIWHHVFVSANGMSVVRQAFCFPDFEIIESRCLLEGTQSVPCHMNVFVIDNRIVYRVRPDNVRWAYKLRNDEGDTIVGDAALFGY